MEKFEILQEEEGVGKSTIPTAWLKNWENFVKGDADKPGKIWKLRAGEKSSKLRKNTYLWLCGLYGIEKKS